MPEGLRGLYREPLGRLIPDAAVCRDAVLAGAPAGAAVIAVGDVTSERAAAMGIVPALQITDGRSGRAGRGEPPPQDGAAEYECDNPAGGISDGCAAAVREALRAGGPARLRVRGEEDLLALAACAEAPDGSLVLYGQPGEGMVAALVGPATRGKAKRLLGLMEAGDDEKAAV